MCDDFTTTRPAIPKSRSNHVCHSPPPYGCTRTRTSSPPSTRVFGFSFGHGESVCAPTITNPSPGSYRTPRPRTPPPPTRSACKSTSPRCANDHVAPLVELDESAPRERLARRARRVVRRPRVVEIIHEPARVRSRGIVRRHRRRLSTTRATMPTVDRSTGAANDDRSIAPIVVRGDDSILVARVDARARSATDRSIDRSIADGRETPSATGVRDARAMDAVPASFPRGEVRATRRDASATTRRDGDARDGGDGDARRRERRRRRPRSIEPGSAASRATATATAARDGRRDASDARGRLTTRTGWRRAGAGWIRGLGQGGRRERGAARG